MRAARRLQGEPQALGWPSIIRQIHGGYWTGVSEESSEQLARADDAPWYLRLPNIALWRFNWDG